jgi:Transposase, Mutator family
MRSSSTSTPAGRGSPYLYLVLDAVEVEGRDGGRTVNACVVHAVVAVNRDATASRSAWTRSPRGTGAAWLRVLRSLVARPLRGLRLVTSDAHQGLVDAIQATLPGASWECCPAQWTEQRCQGQRSCLAIAALSPLWASETTSCTPAWPRATSDLRNLSSERLGLHLAEVDAEDLAAAGLVHAISPLRPALRASLATTAASPRSGRCDASSDTAAAWIDRFTHGHFCEDLLSPGCEPWTLLCSSRAWVCEQVVGLAGDVALEAADGFAL